MDNWALHVIYVGGSQDGRIADLDNRDVRETSFGNHRNPALAVIERYDRTTFLDPAGTGRTIFRLRNVRKIVTSEESGISAAIRKILIWARWIPPRIVIDEGVSV